MNVQKIKADLNKLTSKFKDKFSDIPDEDLFFIEDKEIELWRKRDQKLTKTKEDLRRMLSKSE